MRLRVEPPNAPPFERQAGDGPVGIGRLEGDITVADSMMSRRHARLVQREGEWFVEDLGSRNGTTVNGSPVRAATKVAAGDVMQFGDTRIRIEPDAAGPDALVPTAELPGTVFRSATTLGLALDSPASGAALERQADRLKLLNEFHRALAEPITIAALLDRLLARLFDVLHAEEGVVVLKNEAGEFVPAASRLASSQSRPPVVSTRLIEEVAVKGSAALVSDVAIDPRFAQAQSIVASGIRSIAAAPLADAEGSLGLIALYARARVRRFSDDDLELLVSLASAAALRIRNLALAQHELERQAVERELAVARNLQMSLLPRNLPASAHVEVAAVLTPAHAVGGDLYDFFLDAHALWFIVADASGKGISAALYMAMTRTLFRAMTRDAPSPSVVAARMNQELARDNEQQFFVTALVGRMDLHTGRITLANAGHAPPLLINSGGMLEVKAASAGVALGVLEDAAYVDTCAQMQRGEALVLFTDGVTEAHDVQGRLFETERLRAALAGAPGPVTASGLVAAVAEAVGEFARGAPQHDDLTVVAVVFRGGD